MCTQVSRAPCCHTTQKGGGCGGSSNSGLFLRCHRKDKESTLTTGCRTLARDAELWEVAHSHLQTRPELPVSVSIRDQQRGCQVSRGPASARADSASVLLQAPPHTQRYRHIPFPQRTEHVPSAVHMAPRTHCSPPTPQSGCGQSCGTASQPESSEQPQHRESRWAGSTQVERLGPGPSERVAQTPAHMTAVGATGAGRTGQPQRSQAPQSHGCPPGRRKEATAVLTSLCRGQDTRLSKKADAELSDLVPENSTG